MSGGAQDYENAQAPAERGEDALPDWREVHPSVLVREIAWLRGEVRMYRDGQASACATVAAMHEAATGRKGAAPMRGVVEDVEDLRTAYLKALEREEAALTDRAKLLDDLVTQGDRLEKQGQELAAEVGQSFTAELVSGPQGITVPIPEGYLVSVSVQPYDPTDEPEAPAPEPQRRTRRRLSDPDLARGG